MTAASVAPLLNAVYVSSREGETILRRLTRSGGFSAENVISRLAISRSLLEVAPSGDPGVFGEPNGKQIKGFTLLGKRETATALLMMMIEKEGRAQQEDDLKRLVRFHWERGLRLIDQEAGGRELSTLLVSYSREAVLADAAAGPKSARNPSTALTAAVVGQAAARRELGRLLAAAVRAEVPTLSRAIIIIAPQGAGRRAFARAVATSLQLPLAELKCDDVRTGMLLMRLDEQLAAQGYGIGVENSTSVIPPSIIYLSDAEGLTSEDLDVLLALRPLKNRKRAGAVARLSGGGVILGSRADISPKDADVIKLTAYTRDEVAEIIKRELGAWAPEIRKYVALAGRLNPALAVARGREFLDWVRESKKSPSEGLLLELMQSRWGIDRLGLTPSDYGALGELDSGVTVALAKPDADFLERLGFIRERNLVWELAPRGQQALRIMQETGE